MKHSRSRSLPLITIALGLTLLQACTAARALRHHNECPAEPPAEARAPTDDQIAALAGDYRLVQVVTSSEGDPVRSELHLVAVDSAARASARRREFGHRPRSDLRLVGVARPDRSMRVDSIEWDAGVLYIGCRDCNDGSPDLLTIRALTATGFQGTWVNAQSGAIRVAGPDPAGYFCATRLTRRAVEGA